MQLSDAAREVAPTLLALAKKYQASDDPIFKKYISTVVDLACRRMEDFCIPRVSVAAHKLAASKFPSVDLRAWKYSHQKRYDKGRKIFHLEHAQTVGEIKAEVLKATTVSEVEQALCRATVAWILKVENQKLNQRHRSKRPDWRSAYNEAGIVLWEPEGHKPDECATKPTPKNATKPNDGDPISA